MEAERKFILHGMVQNKCQKDLVYSIVKGALEAERKSIFHGMVPNKFQKDLVYSIVKGAVEAERKFIFHGIARNKLQKDLVHSTVKGALVLAPLAWARAAGRRSPSSPRSRPAPARSLLESARIGHGRRPRGPNPMSPKPRSR